MELILDINNQIFKNLRSKIFPENNLHLFSQHIYDSYFKHKDPMTFVCVLASPTAAGELPSTLNFIEIFSNFKVKPIFNFLMVEWPNLKELKEQGINKIQQDFNVFFEETNNILNKHIEQPNVEVINYNQIMDYINRAKDTLWNDKDFQTDLAWIEDFYQREDSYYKFGAEQAFLI